MDTGISLFNNDNHQAAITEYEKAEQKYQNAQDHFNEAENVAIQIEAGDVVGMIQDANDYAVYRVEEARASIRAARAAQSGATADQVNSNIDEAREARTNAERINLRLAGDLGDFLR